MLIYLSLLVTVSAVACGEITGLQIDNTAAGQAPSCNPTQCNQDCISVHWKGGFCKDGYCWCWRYSKSGRRVERRFAEIQSPQRGQNGLGMARECQLSQCNEVCTEAGWAHGVCINGECWCESAGPSGRVQKPISEVRSVNQECASEDCNVQCRRRHYNGGSCEAHECECWKNPSQQGTWVPLNDLPTNFRDKSGNEVEACAEPVQCLDACQHHNAAGGFCLNRVCWCTMTYQRKQLPMRRVRPIFGLQGNVTGNTLEDEEGSCANTICNRLCRNNNKRTGVCLYGYCWCSNTDKSESEPIRKKLGDIPQQ